MNKLRSQSLFFLVVAFVGLVIAIALLIGYVFLSSRLIPSGFQNQFFFIILIVSGLVAAAFLAGAMRSHDVHVQYNQFGVGLQAGGASAIFVLVVIGGYFATPREPFSFTVRPFGIENAPIRKGNLSLKYGDKTDQESIADNGEATFKQIPRSFWDQKMQILPDVEGYKKDQFDIVADSSAKDVQLIPLPPRTGHLRGSISPLPPSDTTTAITVDGEMNWISVDKSGNFDAEVHPNFLDQVHMHVYQNGIEVYDNPEFVGTFLNIQLPSIHKKAHVVRGSH